MLRAEKRAMELASDVVGPEMEKFLKKIEDRIEEWHLEGVEDHVIQRFAARILRCLQRMDILVSVDHAIFKRENEIYHVLEREFGHPEMPHMSEKEIKEKTRDLLRSVISPELRERFQSLDDGFTWRDMNSSSGQSQQPISMETSDMPDLEDVEPIDSQNPDASPAGKFLETIITDWVTHIFRESNEHGFTNFSC